MRGETIEYLYLLKQVPKSNILTYLHLLNTSEQPTNETVQH